MNTRRTIEEIRQEAKGLGLLSEEGANPDAAGNLPAANENPNPTENPPETEGGGQENPADDADEAEQEDDDAGGSDANAGNDNPPRIVDREQLQRRLYACLKRLDDEPAKKQEAADEGLVIPPTREERDQLTNDELEQLLAKASAVFVELGINSPDNTAKYHCNLVAQASHKVIVEGIHTYDKTSSDEEVTQLATEMKRWRLNKFRNMSLATSLAWIRHYEAAGVTVLPKKQSGSRKTLGQPVVGPPPFEPEPNSGKGEGGGKKDPVRQDAGEKGGRGAHVGSPRISREDFNPSRVFKPEEDKARTTQAQSGQQRQDSQSQDQNTQQDNPAAAQAANSPAATQPVAGGSPPAATATTTTAAQPPRGRFRWWPWRRPTRIETAMVMVIALGLVWVAVSQLGNSGEIEVPNVWAEEAQTQFEEN